MADFTSAIVVPLASPIQPAATSKHDTEYTLRPLVSSELGASRISMMVRVEPDVNRSIEAYATPSSGVCDPNAARPASIRRHQSFRDAAHQTIGAEHNSPNP